MIVVRIVDVAKSKTPNFSRIALELASVMITKLVSQERIIFVPCSIFQEAAMELPRAAYIQAHSHSQIQIV